MGSFAIAYKKTAGAEGGYANDPKDSGGETWQGISRKNFPNWMGWVVIDSLKKHPGFPNILYANTPLQNMVLDFFKKTFWDKLNLDMMHDQVMSNEVFDTAVNMGIPTAAKFLQTVINVSTNITTLTVDGNVGPKTIIAYNSMSGTDSYMAWKLFNCLQGEKYISICVNDPSQERFMRSWASRIFEI